MRTRVAEPATPRIHGFPPVENPAARLLILGSMPGAASLRAGQYYAHPQNLFWRIVGEALGIAPAGSLAAAPYPERLRLLTGAGIALWDALASCHRPGSLDADIARDTLEANDFAGFFATHRRIERVLFNGAASEATFRKHVAPGLEGLALDYVRLPSTSPANASIPYAAKLAAWREALTLPPA